MYVVSGGPGCILRPKFLGVWSAFYSRNPLETVFSEGKIILRYPQTPKFSPAAAFDTYFVPVENFLERVYVQWYVLKMRVYIPNFEILGCIYYLGVCCSEKIGYIPW